MNKIQDLQKLKEQIENDRSLPLRETANNMVFGEGNPDAKIFLLGEAPGRMEDQTGQPFVGAAGKLLDKLLPTINLNRSDVYISNVVKFRPPENRDPTEEELASFLPYINQQLEIINPQLIVTLGRIPMGLFLPEAKISQVHGKLYKVNYQGRKFNILPMYHPAAALRNGAVRQKLEEDFKKLPQILKTI